MPLYVVEVTLEVCAKSENQAYRFIRLALERAKSSDITHIDSEVTGQREEETNPRERGDDDGVEYADPRDEMADRLDRD